MKEINYKDMTFNPFNLIGDEWMLVTAGDENMAVLYITNATARFCSFSAPERKVGF